MFSVWQQAAKDYGLSWLVCVHQDKHGGSDTRCPLMVKILDAVKGTPAGSVALKVSQKTADGGWTQIATGYVHCVTSQRLFKTVRTNHVDVFHCSSLQSDRCHWGDPQSDHRAAVPRRSVSCWVWYQNLLEEPGQHAVPWSSGGEDAPSSHLHLDYIRPHTFISVLTQIIGEEITQVPVISLCTVKRNRAVCVLVPAADRQSRSCNIH